MLLNIGFTILFAFFGWLLWTWIEFNLAKNRAKANGQTFVIKDYKDDKWEEWIGSAILAVVLILVGHAGIGLEFVDLINKTGGFELKWSDLWYAGSGPVYEIILFIALKIKK